jgi:hypothetical protein
MCNNDEVTYQACTRTIPEAGSSTLSDAPFTHNPLPGNRYIRLLKLYAGDWDETIRCSLFTLNVDSPKETEPFEAISYAWGDATQRVDILLDGKLFSITNSLFEALQVIRSSPGKHTRVLWADGICINQADIEERALQVQLMRLVFSTATKVLIWLGHEDCEKVEAALDLACRIASIELDASREDDTDETSSLSEILSKPFYHMRTRTSSQITLRSPSQALPDPLDLKPLCPLFEHTWYQRLWVVQELALSRDATVLLGLGSMGFNEVGKTANYVISRYRSSFLRYNAFDGLRKCSLLRCLRNKNWTDASFFHLLVSTRIQSASDPRDKVYGILGLPTSDSDPETSPFIVPDYSLSKTEVYTEIAEKILIEHQEIDLLATVQHGPTLSTDWPSWIPDWTSTITNYLCHPLRNTSQDTQAVVNKPSCVTCNITSSDVSHISVRGITISTVQSLLENAFSAHLVWQHADVPKALQSLITSLQASHGEEELAFTISAGCGQDVFFTETNPKIVAAQIADYKAFLAWDLDQYTTADVDIPVPADTDAEDVKAAYRFYANCSPVYVRRRFFVTSDGQLGLGPLAMEEGDVVVVLFGGTVPFVLRPCGDGHFRLMGECYVHAIMEGQAVEKWKESGKAATDFHLF